MKSQKKRAVAMESERAVALQGAYEDFILARSAMGATEATVNWYDKVLGKYFLDFCREQGVETVDQLNTTIIYRYLEQYKKCKPSYRNGLARAIRTFILHMHEEEMIDEPIKFKMPKLTEGYLTHFSAEELQKILNACKSQRDKVLVLFIADTGLRKREVLSLDWAHVNMTTGVVLVMEGKGNKFRAAVMGTRTKRELMKYMRTINTNPDAPVFQTHMGTRMTKNGITSVMQRLQQRTGLNVGTHALRRTFATLAKKAGMPEMEIQRLLGHTDMEVTQRYIRLVDSDLVAAHEAHGPIDTFVKR